MVRYIDLAVDRLECDGEYTVESVRTSEQRYKEHLNASSQTYEHSNTTGYHTSVDNFSMVKLESQNLTRNIKEAIFM